jgi:hypothetical protein
MEQLMKALAQHVDKKTKTQSYEIENLVCTEYGRYLAGYQPKIRKQKRKGNKTKIMGPFTDIEPYTITLMGYLSGEVDVGLLYQTLKSRVSNEETPGAFEPIVSPWGDVKWSGEEEKKTKQYLSNHIGLKMWLRDDEKTGKGLRVQIRMSSSKIEAIGCRREQDIIDVWDHMCDHINSLDVEIRKDPSQTLHFVSSYGAMRNYSFRLGFEIDLNRLSDILAETVDETGFRAWRNPSLQPDLRIHKPCRYNKNSTDSVTPPKRKKGAAQIKSHIFRLFHTGTCLYSGKGPLEECEEVFELFRSVISKYEDDIKLLVAR